MFDKNAERAIQNADEIAKARRHEYVCLEHLLYAILDNEDGATLVRAVGGKIDGLKMLIEEFFDSKLETVPARKKNYEPTHTIDRKSTRLNSSHANISYAVFCLKK